MNFRFPIFLDLTGKKCLVIGEGYEVAGKVQALVDADAEVLYINPEAEASIQVLAAAGLVKWTPRSFDPADLSGCFLVITDRDDNAAVFRLAEEQRVLCNAVDDPEFCRFSFGSIHRQGELTIAISTNGWAPAVAVRLRQRFEQEIGPEYKEFLDMLKAVRPEISRRIGLFAARRDLWYQVVDSPILEALRGGRREEARAMLAQMIDAAASNTSR